MFYEFHVDCKHEFFRALQTIRPCCLNINQHIYPQARGSAEIFHTGDEVVPSFENLRERFRITLRVN
jgi:hypothetical protein